MRIRSRSASGAIGGVISLLLTTGAAQAAPAPYPNMAAPYPNMAPREQYLIADRSEEMALARSAAPPSISDDSEVMVLGAHGFETAIKGTNAFVCLVERAWDKPFEDPEFWNPHMRGPICMNPMTPPVRTVLPMLRERAEWALSGLSPAEMSERSKTSAKANMAPATGAMSYMMSKQQYLSDAGGRWRPHVMFFAPSTESDAWGANLDGSPVLEAALSSQVTVFFIPVRKWSDGTLADYAPPTNSSQQHHH